MALSQQEKDTIVEKMITDVERIYFEDEVRRTIIQIYRNNESLDEMINVLKGLPVNYTPRTITLDLPALRTTVMRRAPVENVDKRDPIGVEVRAMIELHNKRCNLIINKLNELITKAGVPGTPAVRLDAIAGTTPLNTRTRPQAVQDYKDDINAGNLDV